MNKKRHGRSIAREKAMKQLYTYEIKKRENKPFTNELNDNLAIEIFVQTTEKLDFIDKSIEKNLRGWRLVDLNIVNLSILRIMISEIIETNLPIPIAVSETLYLTGEYCDLKTRKFMHSIIDNVSKDL